MWRGAAKEEQIAGRRWAERQKGTHMFGLGKKNRDGHSEHMFESMSFSSERILLRKLFEQYSLESIIEHICESDQVAPYHQMILAKQLRLTPLLAPSVCSVLHALLADLGYDEDIDLFVYSGSDINAFALHRLVDDMPHVISLTSEAIKSMTNAELRFTIGHEIGHLGLRHYRVMMVQHILGCSDKDDEDDHESRQIPQMLERQLDRWTRLAEISADRVGFVGCGCDLSVAVSSFFKIVSGLGPEHLRFDLDSFLSQLEDLEKLDRKEVFAQFSHPATPVRVRALQLYAAAGGPDCTPEQLAEVDAEVDRITGLMDFELSTDLGVQAREFLLAGGLLAAHADGEVSEQEQHAIVQLLLQVTGDPEAHFERVQTAKQAESMLAEACRWLGDNAGQERFTLFGQLCHVVAIDGVITAGERKFMMSVAKRLGIPDRAAKEIMHEVLSRYVTTKDTASAAAFKFRKP